MTSKRENVLAKLAEVIGGDDGPVARNEAALEEIPTSGLIILHDGDPGEPEVTMSPLTYHYEHRAELDVMIQAQSGLDAAFDALLSAIGARIAANRTLDGLCDWCEPAAPVPSDPAPEGAVPMKAATVGIIIHYSTPDPLG